MSNVTPTTASDLETAKVNKEVHVRIKLSADDDEQIETVVKKLLEFDNESCAVRTVTLVGSNKQDGDGRYRHSPDISKVLSAIGKLTTLVHLKFENVSVAGWTIPATLLTLLFRATAHRLETLELTALQIEGTREEMKELESAVAGLLCLRSCCLINNFILWLGTEMHPLDNLLAALSTLPLLLGVYLDIDYFNDSKGHKKQLTNCSESLNFLLGAPNIQELILSKVLPTHPALQQLGQTVKTTNHLQNLTIYFALPQEEEEDDDDEKKSLSTITESLECLASALLVNTSLQELKLHFGHEGTCPKLDAFLVQAAKALADNAGSALVELEIIAPCTYGAAVEDAFVKTLRTNYTLQKMECFTTSEDTTKYLSLDAGHRTEMELYLRLNEQGRKQLMHGPASYTRDTWTDALAKHSHDLDALFYYLQINPWLMSPGQERPTTTAHRKRRRCDERDNAIHDSAKETTTTGTICRTRRQLEKEIQRLRDENAALKASQQQKKRRYLREAATIVASVALLLVSTTRGGMSG